jgi:hypothetical protein
MVVRMRHANAHRHGRTEYVAVPCARRPATCPVRLAQQATRLQLLGQLFAPIERHGSSSGRLAANAVSRIVRAAVIDVLRLDPAPFGGQSLRAGFIAEARRRGVRDHLIARHTRHHGVETHDVGNRSADLLTRTAFGAWW